MISMQNLARNAARAARQLSTIDETIKNAVLNDMASALVINQQAILTANQFDLDNALKNQLTPAMIDRLTLDEQRIKEMADGLRTVANLTDPVGSIREVSIRPNGIKVQKMRVPLGVVGMIYEARPNVTADAGALCFKSGNAVILRGGKEALNSSKAIAAILHSVLRQHHLPEALITVVPNPDRQLMLELLQLKDDIDVIIPRGGEGLIQYVTEHSQIPVIQHFKGVCHLYVDKDADFDTALDLLLNGKTQRTGVCNALEGLLVHKDIAATFLPQVAKALAKHNVKTHTCAQALHYFPEASLINELDFGQEYLALELAIRVVDDMNQALDHIATFGSNHTEVICTQNDMTAHLFQRAVDASVVMVNASSRFSDGSQLGLGAEIGIATTKLHAYGPMGLEALTTEKYLVTGNGQIRA